MISLTDKRMIVSRILLTDGIGMFRCETVSHHIDPYYGHWFFDDHSLVLALERFARYPSS